MKRAKREQCICWRIWIVLESRIKKEKLKAGQYPENAISGAIEYVRSLDIWMMQRYAENLL